MKHHRILLCVAVVLALWGTGGCLTTPGEKGELDRGYFRLDCLNQLPELCDSNELPDFAVGTETHVNYSEDEHTPTSSYHVSPVALALFGGQDDILAVREGWTNLYSHPSASTSTFRDFARIDSEDIHHFAIVESTGSEIGAGAELECYSSGRGQILEGYVVPVGGGEYMAGIADWVVTVDPAGALDADLTGNRINLTPSCPSGMEDPITVTLTIENPDRTVSSSFTITQVPYTVVVEEPDEVVEEPAEVIPDSAEEEDAVEEDVVDEDAGDAMDVPAEEVEEDAVDDEPGEG
jgi:hypothetical protein